MRMAIVTTTLVAATALLGSPVLADDQKDARIAACNAYAQVLAEGVPAASPRTEVTPTPGAGTTPGATTTTPGVSPTPPRPVQAPGTGPHASGTSAADDPLLEGMDAKGAGNSGYQQAFRRCMEKLQS